MEEKRRDKRYAARIVVTLKRRGEAIELLTNDVSFRGIFVRTDAPPKLRQLVHLILPLPSGPTLTTAATVVRVVPPGGSGVVPGVGLEFLGRMENAREWEAFVSDVRAKERAGNAAARATDKVRRVSRRFKLMLEVVLDGHEAATRDVSEIGMAVRTELMMPVGARAGMMLTTGGREPLALDVIVRRQIDEPGFRGLGVEFVDPSDEAKAALASLLRAHVPDEEPAESRRR